MMTTLHLGFRACLIALVGLSVSAIVATSGGESSRSISLVELIAKPDDAIGSTVTVSGFLSRGANLYLSPGNAELQDIESAVVVDSEGVEALQTNGCLEKYVTLVGKYGRDSAGEPAILRLDQVWVASKDWGKTQCWERTDG
jgi:hypothetical protein